MLLNVILGFILPWIVAIYLIKADVRILALIAPIGSVIAFTFDVIGFSLKFWRITPFYETEVMAALPMHLGIYPILAAFMVFFIHRKGLNKFIGILGFTLLTTLFEYIGVLIDKVHYGNSWNIFWTFFSYLVPYILVYLYYKLSMKLNYLGKFQSE